METSEPKATPKTSTKTETKPGKPVKSRADKSKTVTEEQPKSSQVDKAQEVAKQPLLAKEPDQSTQEVEPKSEAVDNVDDLLAAVEAMRAKRPGLRARKSAPSTEEMEKRRLQLRETVGRIWASL